MTELEQKKFYTVFNILNGCTIEMVLNIENSYHMSTSDAERLTKQILSALRQFDEPKTEPFEYSICENNDDHGEGYGYLVAIHADESIPTKQAAIDFCAKHGLKIKE